MLIGALDLSLYAIFFLSNREIHGYLGSILAPSDQIFSRSRRPFQPEESNRDALKQRGLPRFVVPKDADLPRGGEVYCDRVPNNAYSFYF